MKVYKEVIKFKSTAQIEFVDITEEVRQVIERSGVREGGVCIFLQHTTMGIIINHNEPMLMQDFMRGPNETYTVKQVVSMGLAPYKPPIRSLSDKEKKRVIEAIATVGLLGLEDRPIGTLSGGQQQRVFLARVLVRQPKLILLDEPFSSLDREGRIECSELINKIKTKLNTTIVVVSHDKKPILKYVDKIIEMENGRVARIK